jgi:hypothetical protein
VPVIQGNGKIWKSLWSASLVDYGKEEEATGGGIGSTGAAEVTNEVALITGIESGF